MDILGAWNILCKGRCVLRLVWHKPLGLPNVPFLKDQRGVCWVGIAVLVLFFSGAFARAGAYCCRNSAFWALMQFVVRKPTCSFITPCFSRFV